MAYLFIDSNKKDNGARTDILKYFFQQLKTLEMDNITFFLTDKDFSQISAFQSTWPNAKVQICLWHLKKAIKKQLSDNTLPKTITYTLCKKNTNNAYFVDTERWICNCQYFLLSRFFICKHLIQKCKLNTNLEFFHQIQWQGKYPFIFLPTLKEITNSIFSIEQDKENQMNIINIENIEEIENYENSDEDLDDLYQNYELCLTKALKIVQEQKAKQNYRWAKSVKNSFAGLQKW
ncbi:40702_t:CDS:2 [Gigaspora margarita]|uniref:40702_t:CDS:1 n=1 Tax=Gigaspora margarita TaxID=4874 RepID=A0ABN7V7G8_GIGMA|nr:40702_t:CDS:2 [Gigaspora margarita]